MARTKGTALIPLVRYLRTQRERAAARLPRELSGYLNKRIAPASWYPESDLAVLLRVAAELMGGDRDVTLREFGRFAAREHLRAVFAHLEPEPDPLAFLRRAFALWSSQHDSGRLSVRLCGELEVVVHVEGFDAPSEELCLVNSGYIEEVLSQWELGKAKLEKRACENRGDPSCTWVVTLPPGAVSFGPRTPR